jgi:hypothetical protein
MTRVGKRGIGIDRMLLLALHKGAVFASQTAAIIKRHNNKNHQPPTTTTTTTTTATATARATATTTTTTTTIAKPWNGQHCKHSSYNNSQTFLGLPPDWCLVQL